LVDFVGSQKVLFTRQPNQLVVAASAGWVLMFDFFNFHKRVVVAQFLNN
jgi:hypothetical protein